MFIRVVLCVVFFTFYSILNGQEETEKKWWNPDTSEFKVVEGRGWKDTIGFNYNRLPERAKESVRKQVWNLSKQSAGLSISFISNASNISVRYKVKGGYAMPHMPSTGVSGVDLYAKDSNGEWVWSRGRYHFDDTISYNFDKLNTKEPYHNKGKTYKLYLPLYNEIEWLEVGVDQESVFTPIPVRIEKPIVIYGTSIAQGACASRPGMAWTSILERTLDSPIINLGFSGNGRLEDEVLDLIAEIDAELFVLDCLPNLTRYSKDNSEFLYDRIIASVKKLREKYLKTPILLVEHSGYAEGSNSNEKLKEYSGVNKILQKAFTQLKKDNFQHIYMLSKAELNLGIDSYVDGTHPNDLGMQQQAIAYEQCIRGILKEPKGVISTAIPVTQNRDANVYNWGERHQYILESNENHPPKICFIGNSIVHQWGGVSGMSIASGSKSWEVYFQKENIKNFGYGWDRIENVLWRVYHGELDGFEAEQIILKIGTNNLHLNTDEDIIEGLKFLVNAIKLKQPKTKLTLIGILPRRGEEGRVKTLNTSIERVAHRLGVDYLAIGNVLLAKDGKIDESLFRDGLHPNEKGYNKLAPKIVKYILK